MRTARCTARGESSTVFLGRQLGAIAVEGDVFLLSGELGAGKTCFIRGIAAGLGVSEHAFSPSFVLVREYHGRLDLYHMDFYRLDRPAEIADLGIDDYLYGDGVCAIEWAERAGALLPESNLTVELSYVSDSADDRIIAFTARGKRYEMVLESLVADAKDVVLWN